MVATVYNTVTKALSISATSSASPNTLYTVPNNFDAEVTFITITNGSTSNINASVQFYHEDDNTHYYMLDEHVISGNNSYSLVSNGTILYMHSGDKIKVWKSTGDVHIILTGREVYNPNRA